MAMQERWSDLKEVVVKPVRPSVIAYDNHVECEAPEDLTALQHDEDGLHMEGLAIRERILGRENPDVPHPIFFRGAVFADMGRFDKCLALWKHALEIRQGLAGATVSKDLLRFAQVFSQILHVGNDLELAELTGIMRATVAAMKANLETLEPTQGPLGERQNPKDDPETVRLELQSNMTTFLYLLVIYGRVRPSVPQADDFGAMQLIYEAVRADPRASDGAALLHMAVDSETPVDEFHTCDVVRFPCAATARLLLEAGADAGAMDGGRDTPLHRIVAYQRVVTDFASIHGIITALVEAGAHTDVVNAVCRTPMQCATTGVAEIILKSQARMSLKCLAAQSVKRHKVTYQGQVPPSLENFIELHGP